MMFCQRVRSRTRPYFPRTGDFHELNRPLPMLISDANESNEHYSL